MAFGKVDVKKPQMEHGSGSLQGQLDCMEQTMRGLLDGAPRFMTEHPGITAFGAAAALVAMFALLFWYSVFSGLAEPVQFIYTGF